MKKLWTTTIVYFFISSFVLSLSSCGQGDGDTPIQDTRQDKPAVEEVPIQETPTTSDNPAPRQWRLAEGQFIPARMPMHVVYPRPDDETKPYARHKFAYPGMRYEIPIGIQGGAWPFKYELVNAPDNAYIGEVHGDSNYGSLVWQAPESGSFQFLVKITDQDSNEVTAEWHVTIDADRFLFIQDGYNGEKIGTLQNPLEDLADWYKGDRSDASYLNKIVILREGNYKLTGGSATNGNVRLDSASKTASFIAFPDELPVVDCSSAKIITDTTSLQDIFVAGIRWENGRQDVPNAHFFWAIGDVSRATWWRNHFHNLGPGQQGTDNTLPVFISGTGSLKENILYKENKHTDINNLAYNGGYFEAYHSNHVLIEQNTASNSQVASGFFAKGTRAFITIRANTAVDNVRGIQIAVGNGTEAGGLTHDHEICWNNIRAPLDNVLLYSASSAYMDQSYNNFIYRNTLVGDSAWVRFKGVDNYQVDGNVVLTNNMGATNSRWNTTIMDSSLTTNLTGKLTDAIVDSNGALMGEYRTNHLGTHGHETAY